MKNNTRQDENKTVVIFRKFRDGDIIALFPFEITDYLGSISSYMRIGQHGAASYELMRSTRPASPDEYASLEKELIQIGYNLEVRRSKYFSKRGAK